MSLQAELDAFKADFDAGKPPYNVPYAFIQDMHRATAELKQSGAAERALKVGATAPSFELQDSQGDLVSSKELLANGPLIISFYRGVWCPYCNMELKALERTLDQYRSAGAMLVAISPQTRSNSRKSVATNNVTFPILNDMNNKVAHEFGLVFTMPDYLREIYKTASIDLAVFNDDPSWSLPMPSRFVIGPNGKILYAEVNPDYTRRPEPQDLLPFLTMARSDA